jgi:peptide-methionine (S)-S-oxide reductase
MLDTTRRTELPPPSKALPGRQEAMQVGAAHPVLGQPLQPPFPPGVEVAIFGMGCFWGAERRFWQVPGVHTTAAGYSGGITPNPTYEEVCTGMTGHAEVVLVAFRPPRGTYQELLRVLWESHDPTQGMRQGNDLGTQYRSAIYCTSPEQLVLAEASRASYQEQLDGAGLGRITTEVLESGPFYYAEPYHQQYLHKNPNGYCGLQGTGVACAVGLVPAG